MRNTSKTYNIYTDTYIIKTVLSSKSVRLYQRTRLYFPPQTILSFSVCFNSIRILNFRFFSKLTEEVGRIAGGNFRVLIGESTFRFTCKEDSVFNMRSETQNL